MERRSRRDSDGRRNDQGPFWKNDGTLLTPSDGATYGYRLVDYGLYLAIQYVSVCTWTQNYHDYIVEKSGTPSGDVFTFNSGFGASFVTYSTSAGTAFPTTAIVNDINANSYTCTATVEQEDAFGGVYRLSQRVPGYPCRATVSGSAGTQHLAVATPVPSVDTAAPSGPDLFVASDTVTKA
jgi:hypothetical protein